MAKLAVDLIAEAKEVVDELSPQAAGAAMERGAALVCTADREAEGRIPGSVHHPRTVLEWRVDPDSENPDPAIAARSLCHIIIRNDGYSSLPAAANLVRVGFGNTAHLDGGFRAWRAARLPVEPM